MRVPCHQPFAGQFHLKFRYPSVCSTIFILHCNVLHVKYARGLSCIPWLDFSFSYPFSKQFMYNIFSLAFALTYLLKLCVEICKKGLLNTIVWQGMLPPSIYIYVVEYPQEILLCLYLLTHNCFICMPTSICM